MMETRVEVRCPLCKRYLGWRESGTKGGGYCRDCKLAWDEKK